MRIRAICRKRKLGREQAQAQKAQWVIHGQSAWCGCLYFTLVHTWAHAQIPTQGDSKKQTKENKRKSPKRKKKKGKKERRKERQTSTSGFIEIWGCLRLTHNFLNCSIYTRWIDFMYFIYTDLEAHWFFPSSDFLSYFL